MHYIYRIMGEARTTSTRADEITEIGMACQRVVIRGNFKDPDDKNGNVDSAIYVAARGVEDTDTCISSGARYGLMTRRSRASARETPNLVSGFPSDYAALPVIDREDLVLYIGPQDGPTKQVPALSMREI